MKCHKLVELMMVSGIPTASGYEERIRFAEMEVVDRGANEQGLVVNMPEGRNINGWDVNVAGVRTAWIKRTVRHHQHAEFILRVQQKGQAERYVAKRYGDFVQLHKQLRMELPGKILPGLPRKNKSHTGAWLGANADDSDAESVSSISTDQVEPEKETAGSGGLRSYLGFGSSSHRRSVSGSSGRGTPARRSIDHSPAPDSPTILFREEQRVSLRAFLRTVLQNERVATSSSMHDFLMSKPIKLNQEELADVEKRRELDARRMTEQRQFYEIARKRAKDLDVHMEKFRRDIVERSKLSTCFGHNPHVLTPRIDGLQSLFREIRVKDHVADLAPEYRRFAEWLRIE